MPICSHCHQRMFQLTPRQLELLRQFTASPGATNGELASRLFISERTVKKHLQDIYRALGVQNRSECLAKILNHRVE